jgi:hypothetical protein
MARRSSRHLLYLGLAIHVGACFFAFIASVALGSQSNDRQSLLNQTSVIDRQAVLDDPSEDDRAPSRAVTTPPLVQPAAFEPVMFSSVRAFTPLSAMPITTAH